MKIIKKLKAIFFKENQPITLDLASAEIKEGKARLHPKEDRNLTYLVKADDIEIHLKNGMNLTDPDILVIREHKKEEKSSKQQDRKTPQTNKNNSKSAAGTNVPDDLSRFKKKTFTVSLYPEEYDLLMQAIQKYGYKRSNFVLASALTATEGTMAKAHKKVVTVRKEIRKEEKEMKLKKKQGEA